MTAPVFESVMVMVAGPIHGHADGDLWRWTIDHMPRTASVNVAKGHAPTQAEAWTQAGEAAERWLAERAAS